MPYFYNETPGDIANFGQNLGQSLGQALVGLPQQRAEMALRLGELQRQNAAMQQLGQYRNAMLGMQQQRNQDLAEYHRNENQRKTDYDSSMMQQRQMAEQLKALALQNLQQRQMAPRVQGGQVIQGQPVTQGLPNGLQGPSQEQLGMTPPTGVNWSVSPLPQRPQNPAALFTALQAMQRNYMGGIGSTNPAIADFSRTNVFPTMLQLQQRAMGQPTQQALSNAPVQPATSGASAPRYSWDPVNGLQMSQ